jgi:hypothetical protein
METARGELTRMRESSAGWPELRYERATGADGYDHDANAGRRALVLWALQYDHRPDDLPLVRWLAEQEALCRAEAPFQGIGEEGALAGFLLAEYRQVPDVWLHWQLKRANFDTWCGYGAEHLVAAGVRATLAFVRDSGHAARDDVLEHLLDEQGRPWLTEEAVAAWARAQRSTFPADPADEDPLTWIERAKLIGDHGLARRWLDSWAAGRPRDQDTLTELRYQLAELGDFAGAAAAQRERLVSSGDARAASEQLDLAGLERQAGDHRAAWAALGECHRALDDEPGWTTVGLGRMYVEELFLLAGAADGELARVVFAEADRQAPVVSWLPLVVLRAAAEAAGNVGSPARVEHYQRLGDAEQRRIDADKGSG